MGIHTGLITLPHVFERPQAPFGEDEIRYPESLARYLIERYTKKGQRVLDPFTGYGTTLFVAEELGRVPYGVEADIDRHAWSAGQLERWGNVICGDSVNLDRFGFPKMDFCMTSPPYMPRHHRWNPLFAGDKKHAGYAAYLRQMGRIFARVARLMKNNALVAVQADNLATGHRYTPLVADLHGVIARHLDPAGHITVIWSGTPPKGYTHTDVMLFRNRAGRRENA